MDEESKAPAPPAIEITAEKPVYSNRFGTLYDDEVRFPSGVDGHYLRFEWNSRLSVAVLPVLSDGRVALIRSFRHALRDWIWEIPKGFCPPELTPEEAARREIREEAGLDCESLRVLKDVRVDPGFVAAPCRIFVAEGCIRSAEPLPENEEVIAEVAILDRDEALDRLEGARHLDAVSWIALNSIQD